MSSLLCACTRPAFSALVLAFCFAAYGQNPYAPQAGQYALAGAISGDQVHPHVSISASGGIVVWQDNVTDGDGWGISAQRLNNNLSGTLSTFRVNEQSAGNQENPRVAMLKNGGVVFVWQGGLQGAQKVYARFMLADGTFAAGDVLVGESGFEQITPDVACLEDGSVVVVWARTGSSTEMQDVCAQHFDTAGARIGGEFLVNQTTALNQRTPAVAALSGGGFVVSWISEASLGLDANGGESFGISIKGRSYDAAGAATGNEFKVNTAARVCANPAIVAVPDGGFIVAWSQISPPITDTNVVTAENSWDVYTRKLAANGTAAGSPVRVNSFVYGDQFSPQVAAQSTDVMVVWTSLGQDGSAEGVFCQYLTPAGALNGSEFRVNTTTNHQQLHPVVAGDGSTRFMTVWSSYVVGTRLDLFAQRYASVQPLPQLPAPFLSPLSQSKLAVAWAELAGYNVTSYGLYVDGSATRLAVTNTLKILSGLAAGSTHTIRLDYLLADGRQGPISPIASATTWGDDSTGPNDEPDGLPDDWQALFFGLNSANWPSASADSDGDGVSNIKEFLAGTNPTDAGSVLRQDIVRSTQGYQLSWNTRVGSVYQVQVSSDFSTWSNLGGPRFAVSAVDSIPISGAGNRTFYRILRVRTE